MKPLYMWAGGKNKMIPKYEKIPGIPVRGYDTFVEPFFGGGAMMLYIYQKNPYLKKYVMNDINCEIVGIYTAIQQDLPAFLHRMDSLTHQYLPLSKVDRKTFYYDLRQEYMVNYTQWSSTEEAATLYFLMKTGFNGIWQTTKESKGRFATPAGLLNQKTQVYDVGNVHLWYTLLQKMNIYCGDWTDAVNKVDNRAFYFMDPPYRDSFTQYATEFGDDKHIQLINFCKEADSTDNIVFYCNRDAGDDFYDVHKGNLALSYYDVTYTAGRRATNKDTNTREAKKAKEVLLYSSSF